MYGIAAGLPGLLTRTCACVGLLLILSATPTNAAQIDIHGPLGSVAFGTSVTVLPNGNIVVTDPTGPVSSIGAVYLYDPNGNLISTLTGSSANDQVGSGGVTVVGNSNFVVLSPLCKIGAATQAGAVTWMNGSTGLGPLSYVVSSSNSLVGSTPNDEVGLLGATVLGNGNYVVRSPFWSNSALAADAGFGAATFGDGNTGISGPVSMGNSLTGSIKFDFVGFYVTALVNNSNYVVGSTFWHNGAANGQAGAATWGNGMGGTTGPVSMSNSLVGTSPSDNVGTSVTTLNNGNYVVNTPQWTNGTPNSNIGAVTWGHGAGGTTGPVSNGNSLVGNTTNDGVGSGGVTPLSNGNYVVDSRYWNNAPNNAVGAVTWGNGMGGTTGSVLTGNSLFGTSTNDNVGLRGVTALSDGNYVVSSPGWNNGIGAVTWGNGNVVGGTTGPVLFSNSLVGTTNGDFVGSYGVTALNNGNYVVDSGNWSSNLGAITWINGTGVKTGSVMTGNSLVGTTSGDMVGSGYVTALSNGNYVVGSPAWNNGVGAVTWVNGSSGTTGPVLPSNSLVGTTSGDNVGNNGITALGNGNYVVSSPGWNNNVANNQFGAMTWGNGGSGIAGAVSAGNSLIGTTTIDQIGNIESWPRLFGQISGFVK